MNSLRRLPVVILSAAILGPACRSQGPEMPPHICQFAEREGSTVADGDEGVQVSCAIGVCDKSRSTVVSQQLIDDFCAECEGASPGCTGCAIVDQSSCSDTGWQPLGVGCANYCPK